MDSLTSLSQWNRDLARAIDAMGGEEFFPCLFEAIRQQVSISYPQVWLYHSDLPPRALYYEIPAKAVKAQIDEYLEGPYAEDPFYQTSMNRPKNRIYLLSRVTAGRMDKSDYYRNYYSDTGTIDEAIFLSQLQGGYVLNLSMMRLPRQGPYSDDEYQLLYSLADTVSALMRANSEVGDFVTRNMLQPGIDHQIDLAFRTFGASLLSPREKDVLELMLRGYGTDISAERLHIARETVRRHRKSIYRKLDVSSQTDLFSLFLNAMSCMGEAAGEDPLTIYMGTA